MRMIKFINNKFFQQFLFGGFFVLLFGGGFFINTASAYNTSTISGSISLDGEVRSGQVLSINTSTLVYTPATDLDVPIFTWYYGGKMTPIAGANSSSYLITSDLVGETITVGVINGFTIIVIKLESTFVGLAHCAYDVISTYIISSSFKI